MAVLFSKRDGERISKSVQKTEAMPSTQGPPAKNQGRNWGAGGSRRFLVKSEQDDWLTCRMLVGSEEYEEDVLVAKPWPLQRTPFDGKTINGVSYTYLSKNRRRATVNDITITQIIREEYFENAEITAQLTAGASGLVDGEGSSAEPVAWIEDEASRRWVREAFLLVNCEDDDDRRLVAFDSTDDSDDLIGQIITLPGDAVTCWRVLASSCDCDVEGTRPIEEFADCEACKLVTLDLTCCGDSQETKTVRVRGLDPDDLPSVVRVDGDSRCWQVNLGDDDPDAPLVTVVEMDDCSECETDTNCYELERCDDDTVTRDAWRGDHTVGDVFKELAEAHGVYCWKITSKTTCPTACDEPATDGIDLTNSTPVSCEEVDDCDCPDCEVACWLFRNCDDSEDEQTFRVGNDASGNAVEIVAGRVYKFAHLSGGTASNIEGICWEAIEEDDCPDPHVNVEKVDDFPDCPACLGSCYRIRNCDSNSEQVVRFKGEQTIGDVLMVDDECWEVVDEEECPPSPDDPTIDDTYETCPKCQNARCWLLTNCDDEEDTLLVQGDLSGVDYICRGGTTYEVASASCDDSEESLGAFTEVGSCDGCPPGFVKKTVVTNVYCEDDEIKVDTEDICVMEPCGE